jgi:NAD(P)-dependent dehydrogenase (short-subunit alcohol dehydrogenase family)
VTQGRATTVQATRVRAIAGDVSDPAHRHALVDAVEEAGRLDLLVNNASVLGPSPQPPLASYPLDTLEEVWRVNALAPLALIQALLPALNRSGGRIVNITSDAAIEPYEGWGGYGSSKAALEQLSRILAAEHPDLRIYLADPGDLRTRLHQEAFPGEDISDRPLPEVAVPGLLELACGDLPSGRYQVQNLQRVAS